MNGPLDDYTAYQRGRRDEREHLMSVLGPVLRAWTVEGPVPYYHRQQQENLRHSMPVLVRAMEDAVEGLSRKGVRW